MKCVKKKQKKRKYACYHCLQRSPGTTEKYMKDSSVKLAQRR